MKEPRTLPMAISTVLAIITFWNNGRRLTRLNTNFACSMIRRPQEASCGSAADSMAAGCLMASWLVLSIFSPGFKDTRRYAQDNRSVLNLKNDRPLLCPLKQSASSSYGIRMVLLKATVIYGPDGR